MRHPLTWLSLCLLGLSLLVGGCIMPAPDLPTPQRPTASPAVLVQPTVTPGAEAVPSPAACDDPTCYAPDGALLPLPLLYLAPDANGIIQLWQLASDGQTRQRLTEAKQSLWAYALNPASAPPGQLAYINRGTEGAQLWLVNVPGDTPQALFQGSPEAPLSKLSWRPSGELIAFGAAGGVHFYTVAGGQVRLAIAALPEMRLSPLTWSPDGRLLLLSQTDAARTESLLVWEFATGTLFTPPQTLCCQASWSPDSGSVLIANPDPGRGPTGLWRYSPIESRLQTLIPSLAADGTTNAAGWPALTTLGRLVYAFANFPQLPADEFPLGLFAAQVSQPEERFPLRPETLLLRQVLWSPNAELAVLVLPQPGAAGALEAGPVILAASDGSPAQPLLSLGYDLQWGK